MAIDKVSTTTVPYSHSQIPDESIRNSLIEMGLFNTPGLHTLGRCPYCGGFFRVESIQHRATAIPDTVEIIGIVPPKIVDGASSPNGCARCFMAWSKNRDLVELFRSMVAEHERKFHSKK